MSLKIESMFSLLARNSLFAGGGFIKLYTPPNILLPALLRKHYLDNFWFYILFRNCIPITCYILLPKLKLYTPTYCCLCWRKFFFMHFFLLFSNLIIPKKISFDILNFLPNMLLPVLLRKPSLFCFLDILKLYIIAGAFWRKWYWFISVFSF